LQSVLCLINIFQAKDAPVYEQTSRRKVFFTQNHTRVKSSQVDQAFPYRNGKMGLKVSKAGGGGRSKQAAERSWLDDDDIFGFHAED